MTENIRARSQPPFRSSSLSPLYQLRFLTSGCDVGVLHCIRSPTIPYTSGPYFCLVAPWFCPRFAHCRPAIVLLYASRINMTPGPRPSARPWTLDACLQVRRFHLSRAAWRRIVCGDIAWPGARSVSNAQQQNAPATSASYLSRYSHSAQFCFCPDCLCFGLHLRGVGS